MSSYNSDSSVLHLVFCAPTKREVFARLARCAKAEDAVVLMHDAVYLAAQGDEEARACVGSLSSMKLYAMQDDLMARGFAAPSGSQCPIEPIDAAKLVDLAVLHSVSCSWS